MTDAANAAQALSEGAASDPMDAAARFDAVMKLADYRMQRIRDRRENEWKVTLGLWALLAGSPIYVTKAPSPWVVGGVLLLVWLIFTVLWLLPLMKAHAVDSSAMFRHYANAAVIAGEPRPAEAKLKWWETRSWWGVFQWAATGVLAAIAGFLISTGALRKEAEKQPLAGQVRVVVSVPGSRVETGSQTVAHDVRR